MKSSVLPIRWPKYWSISFSISSSNEYSGLISFRIDWFDLLAVPADSQESSPEPQFKRINYLVLSLPLWSNSYIYYLTVLCLVAQLRLTLCDPVDCSLPGSSVHGILQTRILEWVATPFSRGSAQARDQTWVSCIAGRFFTI